MYQRIAIVGANGCGKTTLGKMLASALGYQHLDMEAYSFEPSEIPYSKARSRDEACRRILADMEQSAGFVFSAVNCALDGTEVYDLIVYLQAPLALRMERVKRRALEQYGDRVREGGDLYEQEQAFLCFAETRSMEKTDAYVAHAACPVVSVDSSKPIGECFDRVKEMILSKAGDN